MCNSFTKHLHHLQPLQGHRLPVCGMVQVVDLDSSAEEIGCFAPHIYCTYTVTKLGTSMSTRLANQTNRSFYLPKVLSMVMRGRLAL